MDFFESVTRYLKVAVNRFRCNVCHSNYNESSFYIDPEGIVFRAKLGNNTKRPIYFRRTNGREMVCVAKEHDLEMTPVLYMICPSCGESRRVELPVQNG